jgi:hypothetical protein
VTQPQLHQFADVVLHPMREVDVEPYQLPFRGEIDRKPFVHMRGRSEGRFRKLTRLVKADSDEAPARQVEEAVFGGYLLGAYGHFLAESIHRLWPLFEDAHLRSLPIYFMTLTQNQGPVTELRSYMVDILTYLGVDPGKVHVIFNEPVGFGKLWVPEQVKWLKHACQTPGYFQRFRKFSEGFDEAGDDRIYVSRSTYLYSGSYLGETLVERLLEDAGVRIVFPEQHKVADLVAMYRKAGAIAFSDGSAVHVAEISGGLKGRLFLVGRRDRRYCERQFSDVFANFAGGHELSEPRLELPSIMTGKSGNVQNTTLPVLNDLATLLERLATFYGVKLQMPTARQIEDAELADLARYLVDPRSAEEEFAEGTGAQFVKMRSEIRERRLFPLALG